MAASVKNLSSEIQQLLATALKLQLMILKIFIATALEKILLRQCVKTATV
jgi:hypothetical protein